MKIVLARSNTVPFRAAGSVPHLVHMPVTLVRDIVNEVGRCHFRIAQRFSE
ncbi:MAG TPA: hypothetical protein VMB25_23840 [Bryobacteraceae bacterium]|nr:hypothetical protein [Bryobacteraceae bacterium]